MPEQMICEHCGSQSYTDKYCRKCGKKLEYCKECEELLQAQAAVTKKLPTYNLLNNNPTHFSAESTQSRFTAPLPSPNKPPTKETIDETKQRKRKVVPLLLFLVGLCLLIIIWWFYPQGTPQQAKNVEPTPTASASPVPLPSGVKEGGKVSGKDAHNRTAEFQIWMLNDLLSFRQGSSTQLEGGDIQDPSKGKKLLPPGLQQAIKAAPTVIVVGTSDFTVINNKRGKTPEQLLLIEESRAGARSKNMAKVIAEIKDGTTENIRVMNAGKWMAENSSTLLDDQRRAILIGATPLDEGVDLKEAFRDALERESSRATYADLLYRYSKSKDFDIR